MNQLFSIEAGWRNVFFRQIETWDRVADSINPLLFVCLLGAALCLSRTSHANAWRFLGRSILAVLLSFVAVKLLQRLDLFESGRAQIEGNFPSTHMVVASSLTMSLIYAARKWIFLVPVLLFYAWLMTALRYHLWIDILGSLLIAASVTSLQFLIARKQGARQLSVASSTRSAGNRASRRASSSSANTSRKSRPNARR